MTVAMLTFAAIEERLEAVFSVPPVTMVMPHFNKETTRRGVSCVVCAEDIWYSLDPARL
jgi:hypothetical protein